MKIRMLAACALQEAGRERPLSVGQDCDVADVVGAALVAYGRAALVVSEDDDEVAAARRGEQPPEVKPGFAPETRGRRR